MPIHARDLLDILASLQRADETALLYAKYARHSPAGVTSFRLERNVPYDVIRAEAVDGSEYCEYSRSLLHSPQRRRRAPRGGPAVSCQPADPRSALSSRSAHLGRGDELLSAAGD